MLIRKLSKKTSISRNHSTVRFKNQVITKWGNKLIEYTASHYFEKEIRNGV